MKDRIKDYFALTKKEQRGLIILLGLMLLMASADIFMPFLVPEKAYDITDYKKEVEEFVLGLQKSDSLNRNESTYPKYDKLAGETRVLEAFLLSPFKFDPNKMDEESWKKIGMPEKIYRNILRYREKGGTFRDKDGFRKIYGMNDEVFSILDPYLQFPDNQNNDRSQPDHFSKSSGYSKEKVAVKEIKDPIVIELNSADSASLLSLNGIGASYAGRIIKYRDRLGGFYQAEQLLEIRGMDSIRFNQFCSRVTVDISKIRKIDLNSVTFKDLLKHPYFEYYLVKAIFNYKDEIKRFDSVQQLKGIPVMYEELFEKIAPYLGVE